MKRAFGSDQGIVGSDIDDGDGDNGDDNDREDDD